MLKCDAHITCMHASPEKKGAAGEVFLLAFADGSFGMYNKQVVKLVKVVKAVCGDVTSRVVLFVTWRGCMCAPCSLQCAMHATALCPALATNCAGPRAERSGVRKTRTRAQSSRSGGHERATPSSRPAKTAACACGPALACCAPSWLPSPSPCTPWPGAATATKSRFPPAKTL